MTDGERYRPNPMRCAEPVHRQIQMSAQSTFVGTPRRNHDLTCADRLAILDLKRRTAPS